MIWPGLPLVQNLDAFRPVEGWTAVSPTNVDVAQVRPGLSRPQRATLVGLLPPGGESGHAVALLHSARDVPAGHARRAVAEDGRDQVRCRDSRRGGGWLLGRSAGAARLLLTGRYDRGTHGQRA